MPETVLAPTDNKEVVSIPNYSLVENRKTSGDGVVLYIKNSLKYKVVDLTTDNPEEHQVSFDQLLDKLKQSGKCFMIDHVIIKHSTVESIKKIVISLC